MSTKFIELDSVSWYAFSISCLYFIHGYPPTIVYAYPDDLFSFAIRWCCLFVYIFKVASHMESDKKEQKREEKNMQFPLLLSLSRLANIFSFVEENHKNILSLVYGVSQIQ